MSAPGAHDHSQHSTGSRRKILPIQCGGNACKSGSKRKSGCNVWWKGNGNADDIVLADAAGKPADQTKAAGADASKTADQNKPSDKTADKTGTDAKDGGNKK